MKTQQELMQAYWAPGGTVDMVKEYNEKHGTDVKPWECVKCDGDFNRHPEFTALPEAYAFALTILYDDKRKEHRPVFVGDKIYCVTGNGQPWTVSSIAAIAKPGAWDKWSWNPPTPKRTFMLNDVEVPCPVNSEDGTCLVIGNKVFYFETLEQRTLVCHALVELLTAARDKD
jgi:hypothetical protein